MLSTAGFFLQSR